MMAFTLTADQAVLFYEICQEIKAETEQERLKIMLAMVEAGQVKTVVQTPKTKEDYIQHLAKNFKVLQIKEKDSNDPNSPR